jgi:hypothetical protein
VLREFKRLKQEPTPGFRRWFESDGFDLVVWYDAAGEVTGFQICYDFGEGEHALTWRSRGGYSHDAIDSGDTNPLRKQTPILVRDGAVPWTRLRSTFDRRSENLDPAVRQLVRHKLAGSDDFRPPPAKS